MAPIARVSDVGCLPSPFYEGLDRGLIQVWTAIRSCHTTTQVQACDPCIWGHFMKTGS